MHTSASFWTEALSLAHSGRISNLQTDIFVVGGGPVGLASTQSLLPVAAVAGPRADRRFRRSTKPAARG